MSETNDNDAVSTPANGPERKRLSASARDARDLELLAAYTLRGLDVVRQALCDEKPKKAFRRVEEAIEHIDEELDRLITRRALRHLRKAKVPAEIPSKLESEHDDAGQVAA